ncbi:MAG TPA: YraN family protein [Mariprofundaceae bacterium]|nr:YraN family protein [Mariprofundaceae bacterium]
MSTELGRQGETNAARHLERCGFEILARNVRLGRGELDLVARKGELLLFVEVKAHRRYDSGLLAVTPDKCSRLQSAAEGWLARHPEHAALQCRFDLIILTPGSGLLPWKRTRIDHIEDIIR